MLNNYTVYSSLRRLAGCLLLISVSAANFVALPALAGTDKISGSTFETEKSGISDDALAMPPTNGKIAFVSTRTGNYEIFTMNADGSNQTNVSNNAASEYEPAFSPDGSKIAFVSQRNSNTDIYVMNADGSNQTRLTTDAALDDSPDWSPDGSKIVFRSYRTDNIVTNLNIYVMNADGSNQARLTLGSRHSEQPRFSPDGSRIIFQRYFDNSNWEIYAMDANGLNETRLTNNTADDARPDWSPDGSKIVFSSNRSGNYEIFVMNTDGSNPVNLSNNSAVDFYPAWSPDGTKIAFYTDRDSGGGGETYVMNADGTNPIRLTNNPTLDDAPTWQPVNATPFLRVNDVMIVEPSSGAATATFTVTLSWAMTSNVTVDAATANNTAVAPGDYTAVSALQLTFAPGETTKQVQVTIKSDITPEVLEAFFVNLSNATNAAISDNQGIGSIRKPVRNGKIAFARHGIGYGSNRMDIFTMKPDGSIQTNISTDNAHEHSPAWSPDGSKIAFVKRDQNPNNEGIYVMDANGSNRRQLTNDPFLGTDPVWSPDGTKIMYDRGDGSIYVMNADGTNQTRLFPIIHRDSDHSFSPDGSRIVFTRQKNDFSNSEIYVMNADGTNLIRLTNDSSSSSLHSLHPTFSPDGSKIVFTSNRNGNFDIFVMNTDGSNPVNLSNDSENSDEAYPVWSPDGTKIAYSNYISFDNDEIFTMNADGTGKTRLTSNTVNDTYLAWQPIDNGANTAAGTNSNVQSDMGDASATFSNVSAAGITNFSPISPSSAGTPPQGYTLLNNAPAYEITTTASYSGSITICFQFPSINDQATFARVRILHGEGGQLVDRTILDPDTPAPDFATRTVCARVNSLSPFVAALTPVGPTAAEVSVSGRVATATGRGIGNARVTMTSSNGTERTAVSNSFGYYSFGSVPAGETYVFSVSSKRYTFKQSVQVRTIVEDIGDMNFVADN